MFLITKPLFALQLVVGRIVHRTVFINKYFYSFAPLYFFSSFLKGPSTLATLFNHMWPRIVADPSTLGRHVAATAKFPTLLSGCHMPHEQSLVCSLPTAATKTLCLWRGRATACRTLEPQTAVCSPKLENNGFLRE